MSSHALSLGQRLSTLGPCPVFGVQLKELTRLEEQVRRAFEGEAWHGPAVLEILADVSVEAAAAHPIPGAHSIWEIVLHLAATYTLVLQRIQGHSGSLSAVQDWPAVAIPEAERWHEANLKTYFGFYNHERPHQALGYQTPATIYFQARKRAR